MIKRSPPAARKVHSILPDDSALPDGVAEKIEGDQVRRS